MFKLVANWILSALSLYIVASLVPGIHVADFGTALVAAIIIGLVNALVKPILIFLTLPITILTLGLFTLIINAILLLLASSLTPGFVVSGFVPALVGSIVLATVSTLLHWLVR